jgi:hypothetical protein
MYEFIVPQEINISDKIGGFTIPQLAFVSFGLLISMMLLISEIPIYVSLIIAIPLMVLSLVLAFYKKYSLPLYQFLMIYAMYRTMPKNLIYRMDNIREEYWGIEEEEIELIFE